MSILPNPNSKNLNYRDQTFNSIKERLMVDDTSSAYRPTIRIFSNSTHIPEALVTFSDMIISQFNYGRSEGTQTVITQEGEKLYSFDELFPQVTLVGFVYDSAGGYSCPDSGITISGSGYRSWKRFYEQARISQIAGSTRRVQVDLLGHTLVGAFIGYAANLTADDDNRVNISTTFLVQQMIPTDVAASSALDLIPGTDIAGFLSIEGAINAGILNNIPNPTSIQDLGVVSSSSVVRAVLSRRSS
jgi:hypothetical protein